ncbi:hypothetical protein BD408DRAFT_449717 [Parasitella parasitica]|nr:hypothetical protein BD408DRAFT_449717 [Parasitella parasitica]
MALFVPVIVGLPIGYFTWAKVFDSVDSGYTLDGNSNISAKPPNSKIAGSLGTLVSVGLLSKATFTPRTRHRLFFAKAPPNSNIRIITLKMGINLLIRSGIVFYGGASGGAVAGRLVASFF